MKQGSLDRAEDQALYYLGAAEIDAFIVDRLRRIDGIEKILANVVKGKIKASHPQVKAAIYVLGYLRSPAATPLLLSLIKGGNGQLLLISLAAIGAIGPDKDAEAVLKEIARDPDSSAAAVAYALQALGRAKDLSALDYFKKNPPAHADDRGVQEVLSRIRLEAVSRG